MTVETAGKIKKSHLTNKKSWISLLNSAEICKKHSVTQVNFHLYHYAGNNPIKYTDPDGRNSGAPPEAIKRYEQIQQQRINQVVPQDAEASKARDFARTMSVRQKNGDDWHIEIWRSLDDEGNIGKGNEKYYKSEIQLMYKNEVVLRSPVQSSADHPDLNKDDEHIGSTLPDGEYTGTLLEFSPSYMLGISLFEGYMIHPDRYTNPTKIKGEKELGNTVGPWNQPHGLGCQIMHLNDFYKMDGILMSAGYNFLNQNPEGTVVQDTIKIYIHVNKLYTEENK